MLLLDRVTAILGISAFYHDSAACLIKGGEIVAAAEEERFSRKKHDPRFPKRAINYCLGEAFIEPSELAATFRATKDLELKKAVIDTLEHIGSPASLNALGNCFEDGESEVQLYALAAADRLLGVV